jgi:tetratricopeptide (TPR) repeat protein
MGEDNINEMQMKRIKQMIADFYNGLSVEIRSIRVIHALLLLPFLLVLSTVFVVSNDLANGVVSGKYFWFYGSMGLMSLVTFIAVITSKISIRFSALDGLLLLFVGSVYLPALLFNEATPNTSRITLFTLLPVFYFNGRILSGVLKYRLIYRNFLYGFIILTALIEAVWGLRQLYGFIPSQHSLFKLTGSFFNPGPYAGYLAMVFPLALYYWMQGTGCRVHDRAGQVLCRRRKHILYIAYRTVACITCLTIILTLPAAMSRASWIAVCAGNLVVMGGYCTKCFSLKTYYLQHKKTVWFSTGILVLLLSAASAGIYSLKKDSADGRMLTWKVSLQVIARHPFGVGLGNFPGAYGEEQAAYFASENASETEEYVAGNPEYGFNEYLQILTESGIVSFLLFIGMIVLAVRNTVKANDWGALGALVALLVFAGFSYPFSILPFLIVLAFLLTAGQWHTDNTDSLNLRHLYAILLAMCCLFVTAGCLWKQYPVYKAYRQWKNDQMYYQAGLFEDTAEAYEPLYPYLNERIQFLFEYAQCLSKAGLDEKQRKKMPVRCDSLLAESNKVLCRAMQISCDPMLYNVMGKNCQAMRLYPEAEACYIKASLIVPSRLYPWYLLTKLYIETGQDEKAEETAKIVLTKEPKVQSPAIREMREEVRKLKVKN